MEDLVYDFYVIYCIRSIYPRSVELPIMFFKKNHARGFLADAAVQSEARKIILPKYGIREFKAKNFELATLYMYFYGRKKSFRGIKDKVIMLL